MKPIEPFRYMICAAIALAGCTRLPLCKKGAVESQGQCVSSTAQLLWVSADPSHESKDTPRNTTFTVEFSAPLDASTVTADVISLKTGARVEAMGFEVIDSSIVITPTYLLLPNATYTLTIAASVRATGGETLASEFSLQTTTKDGTFRTPELIETNDDGNANAPQVRIDAGGDAVAAWAHSDGLRTSIWTNRYLHTSGWKVPVLIETDNAGNAESVYLAMNTKGNVVATWSQQDATSYYAWTNRYAANSGWGTAARIDTVDGRIFYPKVAMNDHGNAAAVWHHSDGTRTNIWGNQMQPDGTWGSAFKLEANDIANADSPEVALDDNDFATVIWDQSDGTRTQIWSNRFIPEKGWQGPVRIETDNAGNALAPKLASSVDGSVMAVWSQKDAVRYNIWATRYTQDSGWDAPVLIESDNAGNAETPDIAMNKNGYAAAIWSQSDGSQYNVWTNRYLPESGWDIPVMIETATGRASNPHIVIDDTGNAIAVWHQHDGVRYNIWANRFVPGIGWASAVLVETDDAGNAQDPQLAINGSGSAMIVWAQHDGTRLNIWSSRFE